MDLFTNNINFDIQVLQNGPISMYFKLDFLKSDIKSLKEIGYEVIYFDTSNWTIASAHQDLKEKLSFADYYGDNLNAFNDCLGDFDTKDSCGLVIVFERFDIIADKEMDFCLGFLDVITEQSRQWLLTDRKLICLLQSNNPDLHFEKVGGLNPTWNRQEWLNEKRKN